MIAYSLILLSLLTIAAAWRVRVAARRMDRIFTQELGQRPADDDQFATWPSIRLAAHERDAETP